jgi:epoxide hydrolase-like predicted phosphatase
MSDIKVVLFDLGRVLMHIDFDAFPNGLGLTTPGERAPYDAAIKPFLRLYEEGKITTEEFIDSLYAIFDCQFSQERILESFNDIIVEDNQEIVPFVEEMRNKYRIAVLSNTCACHWKKVESISSVIKYFPDLFTSFQLGVMKPDAAIYQAVCESLHVSPGQILFIDDLHENITGAQAVGMHTIQFANFGQLKSDFDLRKW